MAFRVGVSGQRIGVVKGAKQLQKALEQAGHRAEIGAKAALYQEAERVMATSKEEAPVGVDGVLRASGFVETPESAPNGWLVRLGYGGASKAYARVIHDGREPGKRPPPILSLVPWVRKKLGVAEDEVRNVAFLVARKIGVKGTKPTKFLERPLMNAVPGMASRMAATIKRRVERR